MIGPDNPQIALALACLRDPVDDAEIANALAQPIDVEHAMGAYARHAITPSMHGALAARPDAPTDLTTALREADRVNRLRNLELARELLNIIDRLEAVAIEALPYKGVPLALGAYGDLGAREFVDLDILVRPADVDRAVSVIEEMGYSPHFDVTEGQRRSMQRTGHDLKLISHEGAVVELQWALAERSYAIPRDVSPLFERKRTLPLGARSLPSLGVHDELLVLGLHGALHHWTRLAWIIDLLKASSVAGEDVVEHVLRGAERLGVRRMFLSGYAVAERSLGAALPGSIASALAADPPLGNLADALTRDLLASDGPEHPSGRTFITRRLAMKDSAGQRIAEGARALVTPTISDWHALPLPDVLWPLYYPIRVARLVASYVLRDRTPGDWAQEEFR